MRDGLGCSGKRVEDLAAETGIRADALHSFIELEVAVPNPMRERIRRQLGLESDQLFSKVPPRPSDFLWATQMLRDKTDEKEMTAADLALAIDTDARRVRAWLKVRSNDAEVLWTDDRGNSVLFGQVAPATQELIAEVLDCSVTELFDTAPPKTGELRWVVLPSFWIAIGDFGGGRSEFLIAADIDEDRLESWLAWKEQVREPTWRRINKLFGLPEESSKLFSEEQKTVEAQG